MGLDLLTIQWQGLSEWKIKVKDQNVSGKKAMG
jgi:hypothetical protein